MDEWPFVCGVPGSPIGKGRMRGTAAGGHVRLYTPKKTSGGGHRLRAQWRRR